MSSAVAQLDAAGAVDALVEMCADLRSCAIVAAGGEVLAASAARDWGAQVQAIWEALDADDGATASQVHVATVEGELFAARSDGLTAVGLTDRFALASLMFCDLRSVLRGLAPLPGDSEGREA